MRKRTWLKSSSCWLQFHLGCTKRGASQRMIDTETLFFGLGGAFGKPCWLQKHLGCTKHGAGQRTIDT